MAGWLLENGIATAVLAALVWALCRWGRIGPVWRHALWMVVLIKLLMPPVFAWPWAVRDPLATAPMMADGSERSTMELLKSLLGDDVGPRPRSDTAAPAAMPHTGVGAGAAAPGASKPESAAPAAADATVAATVSVHSPYWTRLRTTALLMALWLAGAAAYTALQLLRIAGMIRRVRGSSSATPELLAALRQQAASMKVRIPRARVLRNLGSPYIWCLFRPMLLWPAEIEPTTDAARAMLVHELAHIRRRDHWVGWMMLLAGCAWWWNPVYWLTCRELRRNAEFACDGWVVQTLQGVRRRYAEALLGVIEGGFKPRLPLAAGIRDGGRQILEARLRMIMEERIQLCLPRAGAAIVALAVLASVPAWAQQSTETGARLHFTLSKETTGITSPLNADGTPDYAAALNAKFNQGVTPENNGFVLWLETAGTRAEDGTLPARGADQFVALSGAKPTAAGTQVLPRYYAFLQQELKFDDKRASGAVDAMHQARFESWTRENHPELADYLARNEALLAKMSEAAARPKWWSPTFAQPGAPSPALASSSLPSVSQVIELCRIFCARASQRAAAGDFDGFLKDVITVKQFSLHMCNAHSILQALVGDLVNHEANDVIGHVLVSQKLSENQITAMHKALDGLPTRTNFLADSIDVMQRWVILDSILWGLQGDQNRLDSVASLFLVHNTDTEAENQLLIAKMKTVQADQLDLDVVLKRANHMFDLAADSARAKTLADIRKGFAVYNDASNQWKGELDSSPDLQKHADESRAAYSERAARAFLSYWLPKVSGAAENERAENLRDRELDVLFAAATYRARNGQWPQKLADLAPGYIKEVPSDFFSADGKAPLGYLVLPAGVRIYSVGHNGVDDGGIFDGSGKLDDIVVGQQ